MLRDSACRIARLVLVLFACLGAAGCLSSETPFFKGEDLLQEPRFIGRYRCKEAYFFLTVSAHQSVAKRYLVRIDETTRPEGDYSEYVGALFHVGESTYLDLYPVRSKISEIKQPTPSLALRSASYTGADGIGKKLHVLLRLEFTESGLSCWAPSGANDRTNPMADSRQFQAKRLGQGFLVDAADRKLRKLLETGSRSHLFVGESAKLSFLREP